MAVTWWTDPAGILCVRFTGALDVREVVHYQAATAQDPRLKGLPEFIDLSGCTAVEGGRTHAEEVALTARGARAGREPGPLAIFAPSDETFGMARLYQATAGTLAPGRRLLVCRTLAEARSFLGLPADWSPSAP